MKVTALNFNKGYYQKQYTNKVSNKTQTYTSPNIHNFGDSHLLINKKEPVKFSFTGYYGDPQPLKKLFWISTNRNDVYEDNWTNEHIYRAGMTKWVNASPTQLLTRTPEQVIQSICTLTKPDSQYPGIPSYIPSPNYGDKWGRHANYIEINPRLAAKYDGDRISEGLLGVMKLLPAIPPHCGKGANCIILSQLYPTISSGDGSLYDGSLYCTNLHSGISNNLTSHGLFGKMGADEQVKAFNDLAHMHGLKTGIRLPLSAGQLKVQGNNFNWFDHEKAYIDACIWAVDLGFDAIYFDSAKHIIDYNGYMGQGALPNEQQMAYILHKVRTETGRNDLSFIGEKCNNDYRYKEMGFTAGTDWGKADNISSVKYESERQAYNREYAGGPEVSNDNDYGELRFEDRLNRINSCLWGFNHRYNKLPTFMQINDIFPLSPYINTHEIMMNPKKMSGSNAWTDCERHWAGVFNTSPEAREYTNNVYHIFENAINH